MKLDHAAMKAMVAVAHSLAVLFIAELMHEREE